MTDVEPAVALRSTTRRLAVYLIAFGSSLALRQRRTGRRCLLVLTNPS